MVVGLLPLQMQRGRRACAQHELRPCGRRRAACGGAPLVDYPAWLARGGQPASPRTEGLQPYASRASPYVSW
eukprot:scaffold2016_cov63-Phaeocystis_antarctica.AAC.10